MCCKSPLSICTFFKSGFLNQPANAELEKKSCTNAPKAKTRKKKVQEINTCQYDYCSSVLLAYWFITFYFSPFAKYWQRVILGDFLSAVLPQWWLAWSNLRLPAMPEALCLITWHDLIKAICYRKQLHAYLQREKNTGYVMLSALCRYYRWAPALKKAFGYWL